MSTQIFALKDQGLIRATGPDAEKFLQSQLTCDMREITEEQSRLGAYCNPQGRIYACFRVFKRQDAFYLLMPQELIANTLTVLKKYAVFSKVELKEVSDEFSIIGCAGPDAVTKLQKLLNMTLTINDNTVSHQNNVTMLTIANNNQQNILTQSIIPHLYIEKNQQLFHVLMAEGLGERAYWDYLEIQAGIPQIYNTTIGLFTPHQINYPELGGINFKKGCYPGQEIIARMHYLGKLKQRMYYALVETNQMPVPGIELFNAEQKVIGNVVRSCQHKENYALLVTIQDQAKENDDVFITKNIKLKF